MNEWNVPALHNFFHQQKIKQRNKAIKNGPHYTSDGHSPISLHKLWKHAIVNLAWSDDLFKKKKEYLNNAPTYSAIKNVLKNYSTHNSHVENKSLFYLCLTFLHQRSKYLYCHTQTFVC